MLYWLQERLRDAWLWPLNLVRDFPARSGRLIKTASSGIKAIFQFPLFLLRAGKTDSLQPQLANAIRQAGIWLHLLFVQLFDLMGGPELCQLILHLGMQTTPLTAKESAAARVLFGAKNLRYQDVRIAEGGILNLIFRLNGQLAFATWYTIHLPRKKGRDTVVSSHHNLPLLIHELTHIYQYHHVGSRYLGEAIYHLITTKRNCYSYGGRIGLIKCWQQGKTFREFNREQQAQIIQDYFMATQKQQEISPYLPYIEQLRSRTL